jgi:hypothetical protein
MCRWRRLGTVCHLPRRETQHKTMANATTGYSWVSGEVVTPDKLNQMVNSATVALADGEVVTAALGDGQITPAKFAGSVGLNAWQTRTGNHTAAAGDRINANTAAGVFTITLPTSPVVYSEVTLADHAGTWKTNNLTVARNSQNINGGAADLTCDVSGKQILLRYEGATIGWRIYT